MCNDKSMAKLGVICLLLLGLNVWAEAPPAAATSSPSRWSVLAMGGFGLSKNDSYSTGEWSYSYMESYRILGGARFRINPKPLKWFDFFGRSDLQYQQDKLKIESSSIIDRRLLLKVFGEAVFKPGAGWELYAGGGLGLDLARKYYLAADGYERDLKPSPSTTLVGEAGGGYSLGRTTLRLAIGYPFCILTGVTVAL